MQELTQLLKSICELETAAYPIMEMERLIAIGEPAVQPVIECLKGTEEGMKPYDDIPLLVVLGELRSPRALETLLACMKNTKNEVKASVACEALSKIGEPAIAPLRAVVESDPDHCARLYAYGALGYMQHPRAREVLIERLKDDRDFSDVIAYALSLYGQKEDAERIYAVYLEDPDGVFNADLEECIYFAASPATRFPSPVKKDWRIRYRRLPELQHNPEISPLDIMTISREERIKKSRALRPDPAPARKPLEVIVATRPFEEERCADCGEILTSRTGVPVCSETACMILLYQKELVRQFMDNHCETVSQAFDLLENVYESIANEKDEERKTQRGQIYSAGVATLNYFIERRLYDLKSGLRKLQDIERLMAPEQQVFPLHEHGEGCGCDGHEHGAEPSDAPGRNDPCPCGSGNKFKKCCGK